MNEPESNPALSTGRGFCLWPTIAMLALSFVHWLLLYHFVAHFLLVLAGFFFSAACLVCSLVLVVLRKPKKALSFLIPVLLGVAIGPVPVPVRIVRAHDSPDPSSVRSFTRPCGIPHLRRTTPHQGGGAAEWVQIQEMGPVRELHHRLLHRLRRHRRRCQKKWRQGGHLHGLG